jgi:hypothetical protein
MASISYQQWHSAFETSPVLSILAPIVLLSITTCILTRIITTIQFKLHPKSSTEPAVLPYWIPYLGHVLDLAPGLQPYLLKQAHNYPHMPVYAFKIGPSKHNVLTSPSMIHQVLAKRENFNKITMRNMIHRTIEVVQGDYKRELATVDQDVLFGPIHDVLRNMMREEFLNQALEGTVRAVERTMPGVVSGVSGVVDMEPWERAAKVEIVKSDEKGFVARANLFELAKSLVGTIGTNVMMGRDFLANYPDWLDDFWVADSGFTQLMVGIPGWLPHMRPIIRARDRVHAAVVDHRIATLKYLRGEDPGTKWGDLDDVSVVMRQRAVEWDKAASVELASRGDAAVLMALNVNAPLLVFWMLWYIYQDPKLLEELREEVAPYVQKPDRKGKGITELEALKIDLDGLWKNCPLLLGSFYESMRLEAGGLTYKYVSEDLVVEESPSDAKLFGNDPESPHRYLLKKGEYIAIPNNVHAADERYWKNPEKFDARRFWIEEEGEKGKKDVKVDFKTLKPFGGGKEMCKGRKFAEGEVLIYVAAFLLCWDIRPPAEEAWYAGLGEDLGGVLKMGGDNVGKRVWRDPGRKQGSGSSLPMRVNDCFIEMRRRE